MVHTSHCQHSAAFFLHTMASSFQFPASARIQCAGHGVANDPWRHHGTELRRWLIASEEPLRFYRVCDAAHVLCFFFWMNRFPQGKMGSINTRLVGDTALAYLDVVVKRIHTILLDIINARSIGLHAQNICNICIFFAPPHRQRGF